MAVSAALAMPQDLAPASVERGAAAARRLCSNCHSMEPEGGPVQTVDGPPGFSAIANRQGQTVARLEGFMILPPHPDMPKAPLTREEIKDIAAYITSLKRP